MLKSCQVYEIDETGMVLELSPDVAEQLNLKADQLKKAAVNGLFLLLSQKLSPLAHF